MYLLFYKGIHDINSHSLPFDNLICFLTSSSYSHVEIAFDRYGDSYNCWSSSLRDGGVRNKRIAESDNWDIVDISDSKYHVDVEKKIELMESYLGMEYDWLGLLGTITGLRFFADSRKKFCSEIVASALGVEDAWKHTPGSLYKLIKQ